MRVRVDFGCRSPEQYRDVNLECLHVVMHGAFRPCAVVDIPKERIDVIFAYGNTILTFLWLQNGF